MQNLEHITEVWLIFPPESDVLVPSDLLGRKLEDDGILKITKLNIQKNLVKFILEAPITIDAAKKIEKKLKAENFIIQDTTYADRTVRFRLF